MVSDIRVFERVLEYCAGIVNEVKRDNSFQIKYSTSIIQLDAKLKLITIGRNPPCY